MVLQKCKQIKQNTNHKSQHYFEFKRRGFLSKLKKSGSIPKSGSPLSRCGMQTQAHAQLTPSRTLTPNNQGQNQNVFFSDYCFPFPDSITFTDN